MLHGHHRTLTAQAGDLQHHLILLNLFTSGFLLFLRSFSVEFRELGAHGDSRCHSGNADTRHPCSDSVRRAVRGPSPDDRRSVLHHSGFVVSRMAWK